MVSNVRVEDWTVESAIIARKCYTKLQMCSVVMSREELVTPGKIFALNTMTLV